MYEANHLEVKFQALAVQGTISLCINSAPIVIGCSSNINQSTSLENNTFYCQMNATSPGQAPENMSYTYSYMPFDLPGMTFSMNSSGYIRIWANQTGVGTYLVPITTQDTNVCPLASVYNYYFTIQDVNDPPILTGLLPSKSIAEGTSISPFFLNDYFIDLENEDMVFTVSSSVFNVIINNATSEVVITAPGGFCETDYIYFTATDSRNLSTDSNVVSLEETCSVPAPAGGGGGGGSAQACESEWQCRDWSRCFINGSQVRSCVDLHGCDLNELKKDFWRECIYVPTCYDGERNQGEQGVDCGGPCASCPSSKEFVNEKDPTCDDGIRNQGEIGIDCGGPCLVCKQIEVPGLLPEEYSNKMLTYTVIAILSLGGLFLGYVIFRKEIKRAFAKVAWWFTRRKKKQLLLKDDEKKELLDILKALEIKIRKAEHLKSADKLFQDLLKSNRAYLGYALRSNSYFNEEMENSLSKVKNNDLKRALRLFIQRQEELEIKSVNIDQNMALYYVQELRQLVLNTSNYDRQDYSFIAKDLPIVGSSVEKCKELLYNATITLAFSNMDASQKYYFELLKVYETLSDQEKMMMYSEISKIFSYIKYVISWADK